MTKLIAFILIAFSAPYAMAQGACQGNVNGQLITMTLTGADTVEFSGFDQPVNYQGLVHSVLNSTDIQNVWKSSDNGGISLTIQKIHGLNAIATVETSAIGNFSMKCNF
jgi:hypothetical protein